MKRSVVALAGVVAVLAAGLVFVSNPGSSQGAAAYQQGEGESSTVVDVAPPIPTEVSAVLGADLMSIDIAWAVPPGADGVYLSIESYSSTQEVFGQEFARDHPANPNGVVYHYQARPGEAYDIYVQSYRSDSSAHKVYSARLPQATIGIPPQMDTCFVVSDHDEEPIQVRCFWKSVASASEYELVVTGRLPSSQQLMSTQSLRVLQTALTRSRSQVFKDVSILDSSLEYDARVRALYLPLRVPATHTD